MKTKNFKESQIEQKQEKGQIQNKPEQGLVENKQEQGQAENKQEQGLVENKQLEVDKPIHKNQCPVQDEEGNCLVSGSFSDSDPIGGG